MITLQRVAMGPYEPDFSVYAPLPDYPPRIISETEFLEHYADDPVSGRVSVDGVSEPRRITMYGYLLDCWYIMR